MWLTFSTVAGGIYFHEFENATTMQWMALIFGMFLNYVGLYHLVPTKADHPILIINMEKPHKQKVDDSMDMDIDIMYMPSKPPMMHKANSSDAIHGNHTKIHSQIAKVPKYKQNDDFDYLSDSHSKSRSRSRERELRNLRMKQKKKGNKTSKSGKKSPRGSITKDQWIPMEILPPDESDVTDDEMEESSIAIQVRSNGHDGDTESDDEGRPLLMKGSNGNKSNNGSSSNHSFRSHGLSLNSLNSLNSIPSNNGASGKGGNWYNMFAAKRR